MGAVDDYSESALVEQPARALFGKLGWKTANCFYEQFGPGRSLGRETKGEVVLTSGLRPVLEWLNPTLDHDALRLAIERLTTALHPWPCGWRRHSLLPDP